MEAWLVAHEAPVRLGAFAAALMSVLALEHVFPARARVRSRRRRWFANLALAGLAALAVRLIFPLAAVGAAALAAGKGWGLFNQLSAPTWLAGLVSIAALDLALYAQHRAMHCVPLLWRLHAIHHADADVDATTSLRFHPFEAVLSMAWKAVIVLALGAPIWAVIAFEIALNAFAAFNHANLRLPAPLERALRPWWVTPAVHRLHHDADAGAAASNYGFSLTVWDRLFGSWRGDAEPDALGLRGVDPKQDSALGPLLVMPFGRNRA